MHEHKTGNQTLRPCPEPYEAPRVIEDHPLEQLSLGCNKTSACEETGGVAST